MTPTFNLVTEGWIPAVYRDGSRRLVGYGDALRDAASIAYLDFDDPLAAAGVHRHLEAMVLAGEGAPLDSENLEVWSEWVTSVFARGSFAAAAAALDLDAFWLVGGNRPFLQDPDIASQCAKTSTTNKLVMQRNSGDNALFTHTAADAEAPPVPFAEAAAALIAQAYYAAGGWCATRDGSRTSIQGLLRPVTVFSVRGEDLLTTVLANLVPARGDADAARGDACVWDCGVTAAVSGGPLSRRTATTKGLLLVSDGVAVTDFTLTWGTRHDPSTWPTDPATAVQVDDKGAETPFKASPSTEVWVDAAVLVGTDVHEAAASPTDRYSLRPPRVLTVDHPMALPTANPEVLERWMRLSVYATTHYTENNGGKDVRSVCVPLGVRMEAATREEAGRRRALFEFAKGAVRVEQVLRESVRRAHEKRDERAGAKKSKAERDREERFAQDAAAPYWAAAGELFRSVASSTDPFSTLAVAELARSRAARAAFETSVSSLDESSPRRARIVEAARRRLWAATPAQALTTVRPAAEVALNEGAVA